MGSNKKECINLLKQGLSYREISLKLNIAKSTINNWFSQLSEKEKDKIKKFRIYNWRQSIKKFQIIRRKQILKNEKYIQRIESKKIGSISLRELLLIGVSLYWAEGSKTSRRQLQFSNSDPKMIKLMINFFEKVCSVRRDKLYFQMILHQNINEKLALNYWSRITDIPKKQFKKACFSLSRSSKKLRKEKKLPYGTLQIRVLDKIVTQKVYGYTLGLKKAFLVSRM